MRKLETLGSDRGNEAPYVFDIGAGEDGNHVSMLDAKVVTDNAVDAGAALVKLLVGQDDEDGVLSLLATDKNGVATEKLESVHCRLGKGNNAVVIVDGIGNPSAESAYCRAAGADARRR